MNKTPLALLLFASFLRLPFLNLWPPFFYDEGSLIDVGLNIRHGIWGLKAMSPTFFPPIGPLISSLIPVTSLYIQRLPFAVIGSLACVVLYYILKDYDKRLAVIASILLIISPTVFINRTSEQANEPITAKGSL